MQSNIPLAILASLLVVFSIYWIISGWQIRQRRRQKTAERGWRYSQTLLQACFRSTYIMAGTTPNHIVWELRRSQKKGILLFIWTTTFAPLPYGLICILPRRASVVHQQKPMLRLSIWQHERWQNPALADYVVLTSHQQLGERFLTTEVALALSHWPEWPLPGALEEVKWSHDGLEIQARYGEDWVTADRLVALGTALVGNTSSQVVHEAKAHV